MPRHPQKSELLTPEPPKRERTLPIPGTLQKIRDYGTLTIYRIDASPYWYARYYRQGKIRRGSLKTKDKRVAIEKAKEFFVEVKQREANKEPLSSETSFDVLARLYQQETTLRYKRGEISAKKVEFEEARLERDILPFFGRMQIGTVNFDAISRYINVIRTSDRQLSNSTLKIHLSHIKTILRYALRRDIIKGLPEFPRVKTIDNPRPWFSAYEYNVLHNTVLANVGKVFRLQSGRSVRNITITDELYDLILFMTNTFIRPTDIRVLKHKHIALVTKPQPFLRLSHPRTKGHSNPVVSMANAIAVYDRIVARQKKEGFGNPDDYVFQPEQGEERRDYALKVIHRQFDEILKLTQLKLDNHGQSRSLYSLRHTGIMFRLINAKGLNNILLARNARTSVEMIDRFYGKHLGPEMAVAALQSGSKGPGVAPNGKPKKKASKTKTKKLAKPAAP